MRNAKKKSNKVRLSDYLTLKNLKKQCEVYGADYSVKNYIKTLLIASIAIIIVCGVFQLNALSTAAVIISLVVMMPTLIMSQAKQVYEKNEFDNVIRYMQQMLSSFRKNGKILLSLMDAIEAVDGKMHECIYAAIMTLNAGKANDIFAAALDEVETKYNTLHIQALHKFLLSVEKNGGDSSHTLDLLSQDVQGYKTRTYKMQQKRKSIQTDLDIALILSVVVVGMMVFNLPKEYGVQQTIAYQITTAIFFIVCLVVHMVGQKGINISWLITDTAMERKYVKATYEKAKYLKDKTSPLQIIASVVAIIVCGCGFVFKNMWMQGGGLFVFAIAMEIRQFRYKTAKQDIETELAKAFPIWLRDMILLLQTQNVHNAIITSYDTAPEILKPELKKFINELVKNPASDSPYNNFLTEYNLDEIRNTMTLLYSLNKFGVENAGQQINDIMRTNSDLMENAEEIKNSMTLTKLRTIWGAPLIITSVKMIIDMVIMLIQVYGIQMASINFTM